MRIVISLFILAFSSVAAAELQQLSPECRERASGFVSAGPTDVDFVGVRTWNFGRLLSQARDSQDQCLIDLKTNALTEAKDYWRYIALKYDCTNESLEIPAERPANCSERRFGLVQENLAYISALESGHVPGESGASNVVAVNQSEPASTEPPRENRQNLEAAACEDCAAAAPVAALRRVPVSDPCSRFDIPHRYRASTPNAGSTGSGINANGSLWGAVSSCGRGIWDGITGLISFVVGSVRSALRTLGDAQARAALGASISDFIAAIGRLAWDPSARARFTTILAQNLVEGVRNGTERARCMNGDGITAIACGVLTGGKAGVEIGRIAASLLSRSLGSAMVATRGGTQSRALVQARQAVDRPTPPVRPVPTTTDLRLPPPAAGATTVVARQRQQIDSILRYRTEGAVLSQRGYNAQGAAVAKRVLGLSGNPTRQQIREAALRLQRQVFPDRVDATLRRSANEASSLVNQARDYLYRGL